jgi:hypothetical protein
VILLSQWYEPKSPARRAELARVREANEGSGLFSRTIYVDGEVKRWTYGDFLTLAAAEAPGETIALANTDIEFNDTIQLLDPCPPNRIYALTRWESPSSPRMIGHFANERFFSGTQDVWVFQAGGVPAHSDSIPLGHVGCENAFLGSMVNAGCEVFNPALDVRTMHIHAEPPGDDRPAVQGFFAYPELTTLIGTGLVFGHPWPALGPDIKAMIVQTWQP